jgi:hypothetical protein
MREGERGNVGEYPYSKLVENTIITERTQKSGQYRQSTISKFTTEKKRVDEKKRFSGLSTGALHHNFVRDDYIESTVLLCLSRISSTLCQVLSKASASTYQASRFVTYPTCQRTLIFFLQHIYRADLIQELNINVRVKSGVLNFKKL